MSHSQMFMSKEVRAFSFQNNWNSNAINPRGLYHNSIAITPRGLYHNSITITPRGLYHNSIAITPRGLYHKYCVYKCAYQNFAVNISFSL